MKKVLLIVGGRSGEHEVSLISGKYVLRALDRKRYQPILLIIQKDGSMTLGDVSELDAIADNPKKVKTPQGPLVSLRPYFSGSHGPAVMLSDQILDFDVAFPILHGPGGEDGTIQGLFELSQIPLVGCGTKASAAGMDKAFTKKLCIHEGLPVVPFVEAFRGESLPGFSFDYPVFVKPASLGSSLGVSKVKAEADLAKACREAFVLDEKILIERGVVGREIEVAVFGRRGKILTSPAGEIRPRHEFYTYEAKYVDEKGADLIFPADLTADQMKTVRELAERVFLALDCKGMARIDFFLTKDGDFLLNEINTIPGFTPISMYPKLMALAGKDYPSLLSGLIDLAFER